MTAEASSGHLGNRINTDSWNAVFALSLGAFTLIASEFMPVSLLTPIANELHVSEGQAGQSIAISGAFAVLTSLLIAPLVRTFGRKPLLLLMTVALLAAALLAAFSQNYAIFMAGRALVGIAIGGFWSLSAATAMRLVSAHNVPKALAILNGGNALATIIAAPLGSFLGGLVGWRGAFLAIAPIAGILLLWQWLSMPLMDVDTNTRAKNPLSLLQSPVIILGMAAVSVFFMGQFALFTYVRPFLETVTQVGVGSLSFILLLIGVAGFAGTALVGVVIKDSVYPALIGIPVVMAVIAVLLTVFGLSVAATGFLLALWGFFATSAPVVWWTWLAKSLPHDAEAGGGLMVAVIQFAITAGAAIGGSLVDHGGYRATFVASAAILVLGALLAAAGSKLSRRS